MTVRCKASLGKVIVLGLDGATFDVLDPLIKLGKMPNLDRVIQQGNRAKLRSTIPPVTGPSWVSFMTGKHPDNHGVFDFMKPSPHQIKRKFISYKDIRSRTLWDILSEQGRRLGVMNVPVTYPPPQVNGFLISGMLTPNLASGFTYPPELYHELKQVVSRYALDMTWQKYGRWGVKRFLQELINFTRQREQAFFYLLKHRPWDFFMGVFVGTDRIQHFLWQQIEAALSQRPMNKQDHNVSKLIFQFYRQLDDIIGRLLQIMDENTTLIIMSDHGFGPLKKKFFINKWLEDQGLLTVDRVGLNHLHRRARSKHILGQVVMRVDRWDLHKRLLAKYPQLTKQTGGYGFLNYIQWDKTKIYAASNTEQGLYINLKGRYLHGTVSPGEEYQNLREEVIQRLKSLSDPETGERVVSWISKREEVYQGKYVDGAPDILFSLKDGEYLADVQLTGDCLFKSADWHSGTGTHREDGILVAYGRGIRTKNQPIKSRIVDLAPTILYLMGLPIPKDMDGRVLTGFFTPEFTADYSPEYAGIEETGDKVHSEEVYSEQEKSQIEERLRSLGYLD